jgi:Ca-activated chloride channel family protein
MAHNVVRLLLLVSVSASLVLAQQSVYTLKVDVPYVSLDVSVLDTAGRAVNDLKADDFELYEDGVRQEIRYFTPVSTPYSVLLLFDRSGSTQHKWPLMQRAVAGFIANLRQQDQLAIGTFDSELQMLTDWTGSREKALLVLPELIHPKAAGGTDLYETLEHLLRRQFQKAPGRRAMVVLTDGRDTSIYTELVKRNWLPELSADRGFQKALKASREQRVPVYFVAFNTDKNLEPNTIGSDEYRNLHIIFPRSSAPERYLTQVRLRMELIAEASAGRILFPNTIEEIVPLYQEIGRELGMSYSLGYVSANTGTGAPYRRIEVRTLRNGVQLTQSRPGYHSDK